MYNWLKDARIVIGGLLDVVHYLCYTFSEQAYAVPLYAPQT